MGLHEHVEDGSILLHEGEEGGDENYEGEQQEVADLFDKVEKFGEFTHLRPANKFMYNLFQNIFSFCV